MAENEEKAVILTVRNCARCGETHEGLRFWRLKNATDEWCWWSICPKEGQPILMRIAED